MVPQPKRRAANQHYYMNLLEPIRKGFNSPANFATSNIYNYNILQYCYIIIENIAIWQFIILLYNKSIFYKMFFLILKFYFIKFILYFIIFNFHLIAFFFHIYIYKILIKTINHIFKIIIKIYKIIKIQFFFIKYNFIIFKNISQIYNKI